MAVRQAGDKKPNSFSRCFALARYEASKISSDSFAIIKSLNAAGSHQEAWWVMFNVVLDSSTH